MKENGELSMGKAKRHRAARAATRQAETRVRLEAGDFHELESLYQDIRIIEGDALRQQQLLQQRLTSASAAAMKKCKELSAKYKFDADAKWGFDRKTKELVQVTT